MPLNAENKPIINVPDPALDNQAANKRYVDSKTIKVPYWSSGFSSVTNYSKATTANASISSPEFGAELAITGRTYPTTEVAKMWRYADQYSGEASNTFNPFSDNPEFSCIVAFNPFAATSFFIGVGFLGSGTGVPTLTKAHFGFIIYCSTTRYLVVSGTNADGTNRTETQGGVNYGVTWFRLRAVMSSDNIKFYKNGELLAVHTTNLPTEPASGEAAVFYMALWQQNETSQSQFACSSFIYLKNT